MVVCILALSLLLYLNRKATSGVIRPFINLMQYITVLLQYDAPWPVVLVKMGQILQSLSFNFMSVGYSSPACIDGVTLNFYTKFLSLVVGTVVLIILIVSWSKLFSKMFSKCCSKIPFCSSIVKKNAKDANTKDDDDDIKYLKLFETQVPLINDSRNQINESLKLYIGPNDYYVLNESYEGISDSIWFGWGIFGWINENIFFPLYYYLSSFFSAGIAIIIMVILTRLVMSPVQYKMYLGQAKMRILKPEISAVSEKYKDDPMKRNQETMKIYNQAGANPLAGCVPALIQLPVFYALFCFFPVAFALRGESFLWADDLSSYDVIAELPFYIPFYGDHVSLFPITAAIAMFFYTKMSGSQQMQPSQPGMPNMKFIMYVIPFTLLIFFNNFASGLSLYYTISNILTIIIMLTIKNFILDEKKILATIEEKKKQPSSENRFQRRLRKMQEMMEDAEKKQKLKRKK